MSWFKPEGFWKFTTLSGGQFWAKIKEAWDTDLVVEMANGKKRVITRQGYQYMDEVTASEWKEAQAQDKAKTMSTTKKSKDSDQDAVHA